MDIRSTRTSPRPRGPYALDTCSVRTCLGDATPDAGTVIVTNSSGSVAGVSPT